MLYYASVHQHPELVLHLRERKESSLKQMFSNAKEVEDNLRACGKPVDQSRDEDLEQEQVYGQQKAYSYVEESKEEYGLEKSDLDFHLPQYTNASLSYFISFSDFEVNLSEFS